MRRAASSTASDGSCAREGAIADPDVNKDQRERRHDEARQREGLGGLARMLDVSDDVRQLADVLAAAR